MDKKPCLVSIQSAFAEESTRYEGTFEISEDRIRISWVQPEEEKGEGDSRFLLSYRVHEKSLKMTRRGVAETDMTFRQGEVTDGVMRTSHGDFDLSMETYFISFFSEEEDEDIEIDGVPHLLKKAKLEYDLLFPGQDPMRNIMVFNIAIAK